MQFPPDSNNSAYPGSDAAPVAPEQGQSLPEVSSDRNDYVPPQEFFLHEAPPPSGPGMVLPARSSKNKRKFILIGLLLFIVIVIGVPIVYLQIFFPPSKATATPGVATAAVPSSRTILPTPGKIMTGVRMTSSLSAVDLFEKDTDKKVSIIARYQDWGATGGAQNFPVMWTTSVRNRGSIPLITWEPWASKGNNEPTFALRNIIAGNFDVYIRQWAQDAKAWGYPLFLSFAPEMNGDWFPWSERVNGNRAGEFVQLWRHVHAIFTAIGATNVTWIWSPNINYYGSAGLSELYPGDAYVDWTAMDGFNWGVVPGHKKWLTFSQVFAPTYENILKITQKPMMIAEAGSSEKGGNKAAWITDAYSVALPENFPQVKAVIWFNEVTQEDWRVESSQTALKAFAKEMQSSLYASNIYGDNYIGG